MPTTRATGLVSTIVAMVLVSAVPAPAAEMCPNQALRETQGSAGLPDCRAYEMVSPPSKNDADVMADSGRVRTAADGNSIVFPSLTGFADAHGSGVAADYMAVRSGEVGTNGWASHSITPTQQPMSFQDLFGLEPRFEGDFSPDLSTGVFLSNKVLSEQGPNVDTLVNLYVRRDLRNSGFGVYQLVSDCPVCTSELSVSNSIPDQPWFAGASADYSHVIFEARRNLTADATGPDGKLYEWVAGSGGGKLRLAGILPDGNPAENSAAGRGAGGSASIVGQQRYTPNTISRDGSKIFFTASPASDGSGQLYVRENGSSTAQINAAEPGPDPTPSNAMFWAATPDGSQVFFTSPEQLTATPGAGLYRYQVNAPAGEHLRLLSIDHQPVDGNTGATAAGVIGTSQDGSYVYFIANGQLVAGGQTSGIGDNAPRIYAWHQDSVGQSTLHLVGKVNSGSEVDTMLPTTYIGSPQAARVTPDGRSMVFRSEGTDGLTGYDHGSSDSCFGLASFACTEVYVYDAGANAGAGKLSCASCNPSGDAATTDANTTARVAVGVADTATHLSRALSDDGHYVFFTSGDQLVPADHNSKNDAYEYDATTGQIHLISSGISTADSYFIDASPDGSNVFFTTRDRLVGWDTDGQQDLYDARVNGGVPEPITTTECSGDACHGASGSPPATPTPASVSANGWGNLLAPVRQSAVVRKTTVKALTRAQALSRALRACRRKSSVPRKKCESQARRRYAKKATGSKTSGSKEAK
jgi:Tol biopolymer transport system component